MATRRTRDPNQRGLNAMAVRVGINGFGRIGRLTYRAIFEKYGLHGAVHEENDQIHLTEGFPGALHQALPQQVVGFVNSRGVDKNQLGFRERQDSPQTAAGRLSDR